MGLLEDSIDYNGGGTGIRAMRVVDVGSNSQTAQTPSTTNSWSVAKSDVVLEASRVVKASAGKLSSGIIQLDTTATTGTYYIQFLNAASLPADVS